MKNIFINSFKSPKLNRKLSPAPFTCLIRFASLPSGTSIAVTVTIEAKEIVPKDAESTYYFKESNDRKNVINNL